ncbi:MAG: hypothetical protein M0Q24_08445 [Sulfurimonas sp.]|uniref:hypothetical protein n=1 Tax=Sulfurimonas sp. TaxID=2022749 RepID=UPI0025E833F5|nr:hypothetical protein [Sulfurimonas sp.]MCK9492107.1 hypothetical protein [Sulfurimonas sp.]
MDSEIVYSIFGIVILVIIIILVMRSKGDVISRSQEEKKDEIILNYKQKIQEILSPLDGDVRVLKKKKLLGQISNEMALNIYFDEDDIREVIQELSKA